MIKKKYLFLFFFLLGLTFFAFFSEKVGFHDSFEYITVAKNLAGIKNVAIFSTHPILYPAIISLFLRLWPSLTMLKLVNVLWVFLIGIVFLVCYEDKRYFLLFACSPLTWIVSIQTTPVLPASFFFLLAYLFYTKEYTKYSKELAFIFIGISLASYTPMFIVAGIFILVYNFNQKFSFILKGFLLMLIGFLPSIVLDYYLFGNPSYSLIRYFGTNFTILLGVNKNIAAFNLSNHLSVFFIFILISPLLFRLHRLRFSEKYKEIFFLGIVALIFLIQGGLVKYFFILSPIILLLLAETLSKKEISLHCILSIPLIIIFTFSYFTVSTEIFIKQDLTKIIQEHPNALIVAKGYSPTNFATYLWSNSPEIIWYEDYEASINNQMFLKEYTFEFRPKRITLNNLLEIKADFKRTENRTYLGALIVGDKNSSNLTDNQTESCYQILCDYKVSS